MRMCGILGVFCVYIKRYVTFCVWLLGLLWWDEGMDGLTGNGKILGME